MAFDAHPPLASRVVATQINITVGPGVTLLAMR